MSGDPLRLFPDTAEVHDGRLHVGGIPAAVLAERFGTPLYVYDAETLRARARAYLEPLAAAPHGGRAAFACKALSAPGILRVLRAAGLGADVASAGELGAALAAGYTGPELIVHGNAKSADDLEAALDARAGLVVVDVRSEAEQLAERARRRGLVQDVLLRVTPDIGVETHEKIVTGRRGSKFGLEPDDAAELYRRPPAGLRVRGLHVHLGSQVLDATPLAAAAGWCAAYCAAEGLAPDVLDLGGGLGVAYRPEERTPDARDYATRVVEAVTSRFTAEGLPVPELVLEPGRSVVAAAGVTLYRVVAVKRAGAAATWVAVDGGMGDNLRASLYGAPYFPVLAERMDAEADGRYAVAGRHCESGDVIAAEVPLAAPAVGDLVAVPVTGAYHQSLATPYNLFGRPASVLVDGGEARLVTRRETLDDLLARELA